MLEFERTFAFSDRVLERYLAGETEPGLSSQIEREAHDNVALREHLAERRAEQRAFAQLHPAPAFLAVQEPRTSWVQRLVPALSFAAVALAVFVLWPIDEHGVYARGAADAQIEVVVKRGERIFALQEPAPLLRAGDSLRVDVDAAEDGFVVIGLLGGGRGIVLVREAISAGRWSQPSSIVLDDAAGTETLTVFVTTEAPLARHAERDIVSGRAPPGAVRFTWEKEPLP